MKNKMVIFDFDGVIVDSIPLAFAIHQSYNPDMSKLEWTKLHLDNFTESYSKHPGIKKLPTGLFYDEYKKVIYNTEPFGNMKELLCKLAQSYELAVVSGSPKVIITKYLSKYELDDYFQDVIGREFHPNKLNKFQYLLEKFDIDGSDCLQITDTLCDIREARTVGIESVATTWGVFDKKTLITENPVAVVDSADEIPAVVEKFFS